MGAYLSEPNLTKDSIDDHSDHISYGASSMQGWRLDQEDAHNAILDFDPIKKMSFFAVYDGHGGSEVAKYCAKYLPEYLKTIDEYLKGDYPEALKKLFLEFDASLLTPEALKELMKLREDLSQKSSVKSSPTKKETKTEDIKEEEEEEEEETATTDKEPQSKDEKDYKNEADALYDEATMPLSEVLKRYSSAETKVRNALANKGILSPVIHAAGSSKALSNLKRRRETEDDAFKQQDTKPADFKEQEELDIKEIKEEATNGPIDTSTNTSQPNPHEQDYDEASNLVNFC
jgi:protein phosphatase 1G